MRIAESFLVVSLLFACAGHPAHTNPELPFYDFAVHQLEQNRSALEALAEALLSETEIDFVGDFGGEGIVAGTPTEFRVPLSAPKRELFAKLFEDANAHFIAKHHSFSGHVFLELGTESCFDRVCSALLLYGPGPNTEPCVGQYKISQAGHCNFDLGERWYIHYGWSRE